MSEERERTAWDHTAFIAATLININRDPKKSKAATVASLNPYRCRRESRVDAKLNQQDSMDLLRKLTGSMKNGRRT